MTAARSQGEGVGLGEGPGGGAEGDGGQEGGGEDRQGDAQTVAEESARHGHGLPAEGRAEVDAAQGQPVVGAGQGPQQVAVAAEAEVEHQRQVGLQPAQHLDRAAGDRVEKLAEAEAGVDVEEIARQLHGGEGEAEDEGEDEAGQGLAEEEGEVGADAGVGGGVAGQQQQGDGGAQSGPDQHRHEGRCKGRRRHEEGGGAQAEGDEEDRLLDQ